jgi:hypothetical protein
MNSTTLALSLSIDPNNYLFAGAIFWATYRPEVSQLYMHIQRSEVQLSSSPLLSYIQRQQQQHQRDEKENKWSDLDIFIFVAYE